jgi:hypothetical protein
MAQTLMRRHELVVLQASLRPTGRAVSVELSVLTHEAGVREQANRVWRLSAEELGLPSKLSAREAPALRIPEEVVMDLKHTTRLFLMDDWDPLWLHLVKPYGYLGALPWEQVLGPALSHPILRLPEFLEPPRENRNVLDVALCCSTPMASAAIPTETVVRKVVDAVFAASARPRTTVHVFADYVYYQALSARFAGDDHVAVHDPAGAARYGEQPRQSEITEIGRVVSPWLRWIRDAMNGRSLDCVHFICHGYLAGDRPALAFTESPLVNHDENEARYVGVAELASFLTHAGAWGAAFSSPVENYSEVGLRWFADTLAQTRPGPVLFHLMGGPWVSEWDDWGASLKRAYRLLFGRTRGGFPRVPGIFTYCQPALVERGDEARTERTFVSLDVSRDLLEPSGLESLSPQPGGATAVPNWLAAAQRHVETVSMEMQRRTAEPRPEQAIQAQQMEVAAHTVNNLQRIVADFARSQGRPESVAGEI